MNSYTGQQIRDYADQQGIRNNPYALASAQQQYGVSHEQMDGAFGWQPGTAARWQSRGDNGWTDQQVIDYAGGAAMPQATRQSDGMSGVRNYPAPQGSVAPTQVQPPQDGGALGNPGYNPVYPGGGQASQNPYLSGMGATIAQQATDNLMRNILPGVRSGAMQAGGIGGSRQGVVEANAIRDAQQGITNGLTNLYGQAWESGQNRDLQRYGMDQNFYTAQRGLDYTGQRLGADLFQQGMQGLGQQGQGLINTGQAEEDATWQPYQRLAQLLGPFTGLNGSQTSTSSTDGGSRIGGAIAGGLTLAQLYKLLYDGS